MLYRNIGKPYALMEGKHYLWFDLFHNFVNEIHHTEDVNYAWHFKTAEDAERFIQSISYPRTITDYSIVFAPAK